MGVKRLDGGVAQRETFKTSFGLVAATVGSAVGLGNIWRFPYIVGEYGGAAFLLVYLLSTALIGFPVMLAEFLLGREAKKDAIGAFDQLAPGSRWHIAGVFGVLASFMILSFYSVIAGWTLKYLMLALGNQFAGKDTAALGAMYSQFIANPLRPIFWQLIFMIGTGLVVRSGVEGGIEKVSKALIPVLVILIILLNLRAVSLPGAGAGLSFLFKPDFSKLTGRGVLAALGQSFFSLSLGMGVMITYGSYIGKEENLNSVSFRTVAADTIIALLAGTAIFPMAFAFGIAPDSGPGLIFITLPNVLPEMPGGYFFGIFFFALVAVAALTSTISLLEAVVAYCMEAFGWVRKKATLVALSLAAALGIISSLSQGPLQGVTIFRQTIFDFLDYLTSNYLLTISALLTSIFVGHKMDKAVVERQIANGRANPGRYLKLFSFTIRYITPALILAVFISGILLD